MLRRAFNSAGDNIFYLTGGVKLVIKFNKVPILSQEYGKAS